MSIIDYSTIVVFCIGILFAGMSFAKSGTNMKSFFAGGGAVPWGISGLSLFMGFFSAGTFVVWGSVAYSHGWVAITIQATMCVAGFLVGSFIAPRWHRTGVLTAAEYITERLGVRTQKSYTYIFLLVSMFTTGNFLYPVAKIVEVSTGIPLYVSILALGGLCILYVALGGLWAVVITDVLQFVILTAAVIIVVPLALDKVDGISGFIQNSPEGFFSFTNSEYTWGFMIAFGIYNAIFLGGNWAYAQRYTSVKTEKDAKKVGWLFGGLYFIAPLLWMIPPMAYRIFTRGQELAGLADEGAYLLMCKEVLPQGMLGLMLGGMIFATASSLNATLNISAGVFTNDIFKRLFPASTDKKLMKVARIATIGFGLLSIVVALLIPYMGGVVNTVISVAALTGVPLYLPIIWSLFSKRQTGKSLLTITIVSLAINAIFKFVIPYIPGGFALSRAQEMILGVSFPAICLIAYELWAVYKKRVDPMFVTYEEEQKQKMLAKQIDDNKEQNNYGVKIIGIGLSIAGALITVLGIIANHSQLLVLSVGLILALIGLSLLFAKRIFKGSRRA